MKSGPLLLATAASLSFATALQAQEPIALDPVVVEGAGTLNDETGGRLGPTIATQSASATRTDTPIAETTRSVSVVTEQRMADIGAQRVEDALQYTSGVKAGLYGYDQRGNWVQVRGFTPSMFLDGLISETTGYYNDTLPEVFTLERIEVVKGPSGTMYGNSSVGGLLNLVTKRPQRETFRRADVEFGSYDHRQATLDLNGQVDSDGELFGRLGLLYRKSGTQTDEGRDNAFLVAPALTWRPDTDTEITLLGKYQKMDQTPDTQFLPYYGTVVPAPNGQYLDTSTYVGEPGFDKLDVESVAVTLLADHKLDDIFAVHAGARYSESNMLYQHSWWAYDNYPTRYRPDGTADRDFYAADSSTRIFAADLNGTADFSTGPVSHTALVGANFTRTSYDNDDSYTAENGYYTGYPIDPFNPVYTGAPDVPTVDTPAVTFRQVGLYAQDQLRWGNLLFNAGIRWDRVTTENPGSGIDQSDNAVSTSFGVMYLTEFGLSPYASYSESFRQENFGTDADGNAFDPTRGRQYEIGVKYEIPGIPSLITVSAFDITRSNILETDPEDHNFQVQSGETKVRGVEIEGQAKLGDFEVLANYSWLDSEMESGSPIDGLSKNNASAWVTWRPSDFAKGFKIGAGVRYAGPSWYRGVKTGSYTLGDAMIGYEWDRYDLTLNVRNITDEIYITSTDGVSAYYGERRTVMLNLGAQF
ncbi:TonB-dependent siderophore receptor [Paroceanicella profunda]|uniref:TonB-dependent siderophore receptor n=1 Tax=Paroceanicella profunda TaxID=2579971 RepID=A0A5B8FW88_9RHOB|nr:TonB-dependent siderophore receptor [Paroceanicella profunda]QDL91714.1 TonB-dependent siderophore receptor [Paroceanicella profunda]